jgi:hypothetical protein
VLAEERGAGFITGRATFAASREVSQPPLGGTPPPYTLGPEYPAIEVNEETLLREALGLRGAMIVSEKMEPERCRA